jgi:hydrogenase 3 maturation protease
MDLKAQLATEIQGHIVVMGIGNPCRGDDAAGSMVAQKLSVLWHGHPGHDSARAGRPWHGSLPGHDVPGVRVIDAQEVPENYMQQVVDERPDTVVLIDSVDLESSPGSVALLDKDQMAGYMPSTHRMPLTLLMDYLERETHARIFLIAIQPRHTAFMQPMSGEVHASVVSIAGVLNDVFADARRRRALECGREAAALECDILE